MGPNSMFRNEAVLDYEYLPKLLPFRENQQKEIANSIKPIFMNKKPRNVFIYGSSGIGKTACTKYVLKDLEEYTSEVTCIHINVWDFQTKKAIFDEIAKQLSIVIPGGTKSDEVLKKIVKKLKIKKGCVIALDEIDKTRDTSFLYQLIDNLRNSCIILITNKPNFMVRVDQRIKSRLSPTYLEFKAYSLNEVAQILKERAKLAFIPNKVPKKIFNHIVSKTYQVKDIRFGLFLLSQSGRIADSEGADKLSIEHVKKASQNTKDFIETSSTHGLLEDEKIILSIIEENPGQITGFLFNKYKKSNGTLSYRSFWRYLNKLSELGFIKKQQTGAGFRGQSKRFYLEK